MDIKNVIGKGRGRASAPGSLMLMGEYTVLEGSPALMMTLAHRLTVDICPSDHFCVRSDRLGIYSDTFGRHVTKPPHVLLIESILYAFQDNYRLPFDSFVSIDIVSDIDPMLGFGSSSALNAALLKALSDFYTIDANGRSLFHIGLSCMQKIYHQGSGADLMAALYDQPFSVVCPKEKSVETICLPFHISALYVGYKTPTPQVLAFVEKNIDPLRWEKITRHMHALVKRFLSRMDLSVVSEYQACLSDLGVCCCAAWKALGLFDKCGRAAKISGSGWGDCVIAFQKDSLSDDFWDIHTDLPQHFIYFSASELMR